MVLMCTSPRNSNQLQLHYHTILVLRHFHHLKAFVPLVGMLDAGSSGINHGARGVESPLDHALETVGVGGGVSREAHQFHAGFVDGEVGSLGSDEVQHHAVMVQDVMDIFAEPAPRRVVRLEGLPVAGQSWFLGAVRFVVARGVNTGFASLQALLGDFKRLLLVIELLLSRLELIVGLDQSQFVAFRLGLARIQVVESLLGLGYAVLQDRKLVIQLVEQLLASVLRRRSCGDEIFARRHRIFTRTDTNIEGVQGSGTTTQVISDDGKLRGLMGLRSLTRLESGSTCAEFLFTLGQGGLSL
ncbi:hypothetical protein PG988_000028 [Apiospora saccharicola]